jgi:hypothetical protein
MPAQRAGLNLALGPRLLGMSDPGCWANAFERNLTQRVVSAEATHRVQDRQKALEAGKASVHDWEEAKERIRRNVSRSWPYWTAGGTQVGFARG